MFAMLLTLLPHTDAHYTVMQMTSIIYHYTGTIINSIICDAGQDHLILGKPIEVHS